MTASLNFSSNQSFLTSEKQKDTNTAIESLQETSVALRSDMTSGVQFLESLSHEQRSFFETMMRSSQRLMQENASMARELRELSTMMKTQQSIPPQVLLTKPVTLLDACGKISAFHLDFINSADAFIAVMKVRFKHEGVTHTGIKMVEDTQFVLNDYRGSLPMSKPWNQIMKPNQKVNMSMIFRRTVQPSACPVCESQCEGSGEGTEWYVMSDHVPCLSVPTKSYLARNAGCSIDMFWKRFH